MRGSDSRYLDKQIEGLTLEESNEARDNEGENFTGKNCNEIPL